MHNTSIELLYIRLFTLVITIWSIVGSMIAISLLSLGEKKTPTDDKSNEFGNIYM